ncbi:MAG TPA: potassium-transporting ATPase subunit C [Candidatus Margulisbacteria bacterium]|nr:MAG: potassium-transporting ATPase subunit C [Candidatus Margulisbacteria bacterium GWF2_38_17]OGI11222.1 MAG: potassium-transporting ATPase subunit C [Candidatus Margulisbacteria bacterium GWE2_39_32]HCT85893.1 potassium-transporting ATPase subunit C [Candidatus Margulisiibacteriota bacterium]
MSQLKTAIILYFAFFMLLSVGYPLVITVVGQVLFPIQANGSLILNSEKKIVGSALIGQFFTDEEYFWSRPSATLGYPYNSLVSGGSQLGPTNSKLLDKVKGRVELLRHLGSNGVLPADMVMASGSGLDPDISIESALLQVPRVARARRMKEGSLRSIVSNHAERRQLSFLGVNRVNVLKLNRALDQMRASEEKGVSDGR